MAICGYLASALDERITTIRLEDMFVSYEDLVTTKLYSRLWDEEIITHGFLRELDLVDILPALHAEITP